MVQNKGEELAMQYFEYLEKQVSKKILLILDWFLSCEECRAKTKAERTGGEKTSYKGGIPEAKKGWIFLLFLAIIKIFLFCFLRY